METRSIIGWIRLAVVAACLVLGLTAEFEGRFVVKRMVPPGVLAGLHLVLAGLFWKNTKAFPPRATRPGLALLAQFVISMLGPEVNAWIVNPLTVALALPRSGHWPWLASVPFGALASHGAAIGIDIASSGIPLEKLPVGDLAATAALSWLEVLIWGSLAYMAGMLIVRMEEDRRRLTALHAELVSSRAMLAESSRLAERLEIARELHDSLGHHLTTLNLELEIARHGPAEEREPQIQKAQFLARLLLADLRDTVAAGRRDVLAGLPEALGALVKGVAHLGVRLQVEEGLPPLSAARAQALLRCAQEGVTNALRHGAPPVQVTLERVDGALELRVEDGGPGCAAPVPGNGLRGILERVGELRGTAAFESPGGGGFRLRVRLPWEETA